MPFFSVLLPVCNSQSSIHDCLESIACQHFTDFSVLILVNNSFDLSLDICTTFCISNSRFEVLDLQDSCKSLPDVLNKGIVYLRDKCDYIVRHDADDYMLPSRLSDTFQALMCSHVQPLIHSGNAYIADSSRPYFPYGVSINDYEIKSRLLLSSPFIHPAITFKSSIEFLYDTRFVYAQDLKFFIDNLFSGHYSFSSTPYIQYTPSVSSFYKRAMQLSLHDVAISSLHKKLIPGFPISSSHQLRCHFVTDEFRIFPPKDIKVLQHMLYRLNHCFFKIYTSSPLV